MGNGRKCIPSHASAAHGTCDHAPGDIGFYAWRWCALIVNPSSASRQRLNRQTLASMLRVRLICRYVERSHRLNAITKAKSKLIYARQTFHRIDQLMTRVDALQLAIGRIEQRQLKMVNPERLQDNEFKVYSQWGEDGIIQFLLRKIDIRDRIFVEFGVEDYKEANTRFLLQNDYWSGLVLDGSKDNIQAIKRDPIYWARNLKAECAFITRENINDLIANNGICGNIGLLSIDIDGNDYWVWEAIDCINPVIVICEYNSLFGCRRPVAVPYDASFVRRQAHYSMIYYGASIAALHRLGTKRGYSLIGTNRSGCNAFFVRDDSLGDLRTYSPEQAYMRVQSRESHDINGNLTFLGHDQEVELISEMPLFDLELQRTVRVKDVWSGGD